MVAGTLVQGRLAGLPQRKMPMLERLRLRNFVRKSTEPTKFLEHVQKPFDAARPLTFMHIPKTSGMALTSGLSAALPPPAIIGGFDHCIFGDFQGFETLAPSERQRIFQSPDAMPADVRLIAGHFALSTLRQAYPGAQAITVLREPFTRLLSHWIYWRQQTDAMLAGWGTWGDRVRLARQPLAGFLSEPVLACQTDNLTLRMLLWPHPLLPPGRFIDPADDERLTVEAMARLGGFDFVGVVEDEGILQELGRWLGGPIEYARINETGAVPAEFRAPLHRQLTAEAYELLAARSRLDFRIWAAVAGERVSDIAQLRERTLMTNIARYGALMDFKQDADRVASD